MILADDLDRALESCEKEVIATHLAEAGTAASLRDWLTQALGSAEYAEQLFLLCERLEIGRDTIIAEQGDPAHSMHFILESRIGIIVKMDDGRMIRVRSLGPHTTIGEMGLITRQKRSATIKAEVPSVLYELSADAYERTQASERRAGPSPAHVYRARHGRAAELRQQGDRRAAPLKPVAAGNRAFRLRRIAATPTRDAPATGRNFNEIHRLTRHFRIGLIPICEAALPARV